MDRLIELRHVLAPVAGAGAILLSAFGLDLGLVSIAVGAFVWGGTALILSPSNRFLRSLTAAGAGMDAKRIAQELEEATARIRRLRRIAPEIENVGLRGNLEQIATSATVIVDDLAQSPSDYGRMRKPLAQYLTHAVTVAERLVAMRGVGAVDYKMEQQAAKVMADLVRVFREYKRRLAEDDSFDLDARLRLLESEIVGEGLRPDTNPPPQEAPMPPLRSQETVKRDVSQVWR